jgi:hypothetical protein
MPGGGNPVLKVRLPGGHWVWSISDPWERNAEVKKALDWYWRYRRQLQVAPASTASEVAAHLDLAIGVLQDCLEYLDDLVVEMGAARKRQGGER